MGVFIHWTRLDWTDQPDAQMVKVKTDWCIASSISERSHTHLVSFKQGGYG